MIAIMFYIVACWKVPFYICLLGIDLPEDAIVLKRQVSLTDECYWHIVAEEAFVSNQDHDNIRETIWTENRYIMGESLDPMDCIDWSVMTPAAVSESCCASYISVKEMDKLAACYPGYQKWYCVSLSMHGKALMVFAFFRIIAILMIVAVTGIILRIKRKKRHEACI